MRHLRAKAALLFAIVVVALVRLTPAAEAALDCHSLSLPVEVDGSRYHMRGRLCRPVGWQARPLQILLAGASYTASYWDFPVQSAHYSYVQAATSRGYATLAIDRLGTGASDRPPAEKLTVALHGEALHQVVGHVRSGAIPGVRPRQVVVVGHSLGAFVAQWEAARYGDVDALVVTGALRAAPVGAAELVASLVPAQLDPRLAGAPLGYLTTREGTRGELFYNLATADPIVVAADEATKDTLSAAELATLGDATDAAVAAAIDIPVLIVTGEFDNVWCPSGCDAPDSPARTEASAFISAPVVDTLVLSDAGHVVNLHPNAGEWYSVAGQWLDRLFVPRGLHHQEPAASAEEMSV